MMKKVNYNKENFQIKENFNIIEKKTNINGYLNTLIFFEFSKQFLIGMLLFLSFRLSGYSIISFYYLKNIGFKIYQSYLILLGSFIGTLSISLFFKYFGKRKPFFIFFSLSLTLQFIFAIYYLIYDDKYPNKMLYALVIFTMISQLSLWNMPLIYVPEILPSKLYYIATLGHWLGLIIISNINFYLKDSTEEYGNILFGFFFVSLFIFVYLYLFMIETSQKNFEEISKEFDKTKYRKIEQNDHIN